MCGGVCVYGDTVLCLYFLIFFMYCYVWDVSVWLKQKLQKEQIPSLETLLACISGHTYEKCRYNISDTLQKHYDDKVIDVSRDDGYVWYLPYHPVLHPHNECGPTKFGLFLIVLLGTRVLH